MAALPESLDLSDSAGAAPSTATVQPTNFGLEAAGATAERYEVGQRRNTRLNAQVQQAQARKEALPVMQQYESANADAYSADAAAYTGAPGFAADQIAQAKERGQLVLGGDAAQALSPQAQSELSAMIDRHVAQTGQVAIDHEAAVRAQPILDQKLAVQTTQLSSGLSSYYSALAPLTAAQKLAYDPSQGGWAQQSLAAHDQAAQVAVNSAPPSIQPMLQEKLAQTRVEVAANGAAQEASLHDAYVTTNMQKSIAAGVNAVMTDPTQYDSVASTVLPTAIASLPVAVRAKASQDAGAQLVTARVKGLIDHGQADQAVEELGGPDGKPGRFDTILEPQTKEALLSEALGAARSPAINSQQQADALQNLDQRVQTTLKTLATTGQLPKDAVSEDQMSAAYGFGKAAELSATQQELMKQGAAIGGVRSLANPDLAAVINTPRPDIGSSTTAQIQAWQVMHDAATAEQQAREKDAGAWVWGQAASTGQKGKGAGAYSAPGQAAAGAWTLYSSDPTPQNGAAYAGKMVAAYEAGHFPTDQWKMVPAPVAARLAASVNSAPPEARQQALASLASVVQGLPEQIRASTGALISPQLKLIQQLQQDGKLSASDATALADFGADQGRLARWAAASADPRAAKPLDPKDEQAVSAAVNSSLSPWLAAIAPLDGQNGLAQARIDRTMQTARWLMLTQGMKPQAAAQSAAGDISSGEVLVRSQRMPATVASGSISVPAVGFGGLRFPNASSISGAAAVVRGQSQVVSDLIANGGARLFPPSSAPGTQDQARAQAALQLQTSAKWITAADGRTSILMAPAATGYKPVVDRYGQMVTSDWATLQRQAQPGAQPLFGNPTASTPHTQAGQPVAAMSTDRLFPLFMQAIAGQESGGKEGARSPAGALGKYQVMPETARTYAAQIYGAPLDEHRLQYDDAYAYPIAAQIAHDALAQNGNNPVLASAQYHSGRGVLTGYVNKTTGVPFPGLFRTIGDPRDGSMKMSEWAAHVPATMPELRAYIPGVANRFIALMHQAQQN